MRRQAIIGALLLIGVGVVLGATVFRADIAQATGFDKPTNVVIANSPAKPVPVLEQGARTAFAFFKNDSFGSPEDSHVISFTVPAGKRLVIQSVAVNGALAPGVKLVGTAVQAHVNGQLEDYIMAPTFTGTTTGGRDFYIASQPATIYADGGTEVDVFATRDTMTGSGIMNASVQGYLIDCTAVACS